MNIARTAVVAASLLMVSAAALADAPPAEVVPPVEKGKTVTVRGKLEAGRPMPDLSWASSSSVACFPATQNEKFRANHALFQADLPARSTMTITLVPADPAADLSLYAMEFAPTRRALPPLVPSAVSCEADHRWDHPKRGKTQDRARTVILSSISNPYDVVIGVSGPRGARGDFTLKIDVR